MKMYVLTYEINDYDQYGQYFKNVFDHKPSREELRKELKEEGVANIEDVIDNLLNNGGGRLRSEYQWFYLLEK